MEKKEEDMPGDEKAPMSPNEDSPMSPVYGPTPEDPLYSVNVFASIGKLTGNINVSGSFLDPLGGLEGGLQTGATASLPRTGSIGCGSRASRALGVG